MAKELDKHAIYEFDGERKSKYEQILMNFNVKEELGMCGNLFEDVIRLGTNDNYKLGLGEGMYKCHNCKL